MDALNGYGAGLPQPAYYDFLWKRANESAGGLLWRETALDLASGFTRQARAEGHAIAVPQQVEMIRVAEALAQMRGRPGALRHDLIDAARTALVKGEAGPREAWTERLIEYLRGNAIGDVPASAGSPPLASMPLPSSPTVNLIAFAVVASERVTRLAPACLTTFCSASFTAISNG